MAKKYKPSREGVKAEKAKHKEAVKTKLTSTRTGKEVSGFVTFFRKHGIIGLAIGFVVGTQARALIDQFSNSFVNPLIGLILGTGEGLTNKTFYFTISGKTAQFAWGSFLFSLINFMLIVLLIYLTFRFFRLDKLEKQ